MLRYTNVCCILGKYMTNNVPVMLSPIIQPTITKHNVRYIRKHWNPKYKKLRAQKFIKIELPNFQEDDEITPEKARTYMKKRGLAPARPWQELEMFLSTTGTVFEPYIPPEGDGKFSAITKEGAKQKFEFLEKKSKSVMSVRKIKSFDEDFTTRDFPDIAMDVYLKAHETLTTGKKEDLSLYVTEKAYLEMTHNIERKLFRWKFLQSLEPPRVVHVRCTSILSKTNVFAQVTVRFHTQQILAIYDRFGRLMHGSETIPKDVLEYVVFEKHLANQYGTWRLHAKIIPPWMEPQQTHRKTFIVPKEAGSESDRTPDTVYTPPKQSENVTTKVEEPSISR